MPIGETSGTFSSNEETTFSPGPIRAADVAIKQFKLDALGTAKPSDIAQVGITSVSFDHTTGSTPPSVDSGLAVLQSGESAT